MDYGKYIIVKADGIPGIAIMFDLLLEHSQMAAGFEDVVSAGFFTVVSKPHEKDKFDICVNTFGKSVSLNLQSRPKKDAKLIKRVLREDWDY